MNLTVVMHRPQDLVNIASVVRLMKNFRLPDLRLVEPAEYDVRRIEGIAHQSGDVLKRVQHHETLTSALGDCTHVVGLTARGRAAKRNYLRPHEAVPEMLAAAASGRTAIVLGPEDRGLANEDLDRCHRAVVIPTNPDYPSLNVAQAFNVMAYELYRAREGEAAFKPPKRKADPATHEAMEHLFRDVEHALSAIAFFKGQRTAERIMRSMRTIALRAPLDAREVTLLRAIALEVVHYLERNAARGTPAS